MKARRADALRGRPPDFRRKVGTSGLSGNYTTNYEVLCLYPKVE